MRVPSAEEAARGGCAGESGLFGCVRLVVTVATLVAGGVALTQRGALPPRGAVALLADLVLQVLLTGEPHRASGHGFGQSYATYRAGAGHVRPRPLDSTERRRTVAA